jgi:putative endonuclease
MAWFTYVLECSDGSLYCGVTTSLERRLDQHNKGTASRYTRRGARFGSSLRGRRSREAPRNPTRRGFKSLARAEKKRVVATRCAATASIELSSRSAAPIVVTASTRSMRSPQRPQRLAFELPHPLGGDADPRAELAECLRISPSESEPVEQDVAMYALVGIEEHMRGERQRFLPFHVVVHARSGRIRCRLLEREAAFDWERSATPHSRTRSAVGGGRLPDARDRAVPGPRAHQCARRRRALSGGAR